MQSREFGEELLGTGVRDLLGLCVPASAFQEDAVQVDSILWRLGQLRLWICDIIQGPLAEGEKVDLFVVLSRKVLHSAGKECLRKEDAADPKHWRSMTQVIPHLEELASSQYINIPTAKRLQRQRPLLRPQCRHLVDQQRLAQAFQVNGHDNETLDSLSEVLQCGRHLPQELVVPKALLLHHSVHGLLIHCGKLVFAQVKREWARKPRLDGSCCRVHHFIG
mmetsp:Transcript_1498/g.3309  ORF Transcript_1498/g.3309 Transcript_1498/m.3309 type:complete len:221 (+) Transcript_1498:364-1026(+)